MIRQPARLSSIWNIQGKNGIKEIMPWQIFKQCWKEKAEMKLQKIGSVMWRMKVKKIDKDVKTIKRRQVQNTHTIEVKHTNN